MSTKNTHSSETLAVHAGLPRGEYLPVVPPIYQTSTFAFENAEQGQALFRGEGDGYIYSRMGNPTVEGLERSIATLEGGHAALACGSGMAASHTALATLVGAGDHVICSEAVYGPTNTLLDPFMAKFGVESSFVDTSDLDAVRAAMRPNTKVVFVETPGNPTLVVSDIAAIARIAHAQDATLVVDNTFSSPILQQPLKLGADVVVHSLTKFLNGHADVVGGIVVVDSEERYQAARTVLNHIGGVLPPMESFLVHRGIRTLAIRMQRHCENAQMVAEFLESHTAVRWARYPGLPSHPQHELAKKQMSGFGGLISFELKGGLEAGKVVMDGVELCVLAVSLGGVETLIQHPAGMTHSKMPADVRGHAGITDGLVRLSVGIENADELIADLDQALGRI